MWQVWVPDGTVLQLPWGAPRELLTTNVRCWTRRIVSTCSVPPSAFKLDSIFFLVHRSHSISFTRAQGIPKYKIRFGREKDGRAEERLVEGGGGLHQVSELDLFHPLYHSATLRRLYVDIIRGVDVVATTCIRDCDKDGLLSLASPTVAAGACDHVPEEGKSSYFTCYLVVVTICCSHARQHVLFGCASPAES